MDWDWCFVQVWKELCRQRKKNYPIWKQASTALKEKSTNRIIGRMNDSNWTTKGIWFCNCTGWLWVILLFNHFLWVFVQVALRPFLQGKKSKGRLENAATANAGKIEQISRRPRPFQFLFQAGKQVGEFQVRYKQNASWKKNKLQHIVIQLIQADLNCTVTCTGRSSCLSTLCCLTFFKCHTVPSQSLVSSQQNKIWNK